ncbi:MAG: Zn-dependent protease [Marivirga sp.]|nr:Zn-dependent protease [Marivirga sp.]
MKTFLYLLVCITLFTCQSTPNKENANRSSDPDIDKLKALDIKIGEPQPGEWLYVHPENGQSFEQYIKSKPVTPNEVTHRIYLQPLGEFSKAQTNVVQFTADYLKIFFDLEVIILPILNDSIIPDSARRFHGTEHEQLLTTSILNYLQVNIPKDGLVIMAVTSKDLFPGGNYNFVFGQARTTKRVGVSSMYRYSDEPIDTLNYSISLERLIKTSSHEISHMLSCQHCTYSVCVMNGSNSLSESDSRPNRLCSECHSKLHWNLGFDVKLRLKKLRVYFSKHKLKRDHQLTIQDLQMIE